MTAHIAKILESASPIAIETATSQKTAKIIPFPSREVQPELETVAEPLPPVEPEFGASALIERDALTRAVEIASNVVEKRNRIPILSNVSIRGYGQSAVVTGTDLDVEIAVTVSAAADREFGTTLPAHLLKDLLKKASASEFVAMTTGEERDSLDFERAKFSLQPLPFKDFPELYFDAGTPSFTMKGDEFRSMIEGTADAISTEDSRYYLNGIYFHILNYGNRRNLVAVATDGHRLYKQECEMPFGSDDMPSVIIPRKTVTILRKLLKGKACPKSVSISVTEAKFRVSFDGIVITSKTVDGTYPDYQRVVPRYNSKIATINAAELIEGVETVSLISSERGRAVKFEMADGNCRLVVNNPDSGSATMDVACDYSGDPMEVGFNAKYLISAIKDASVSCDNVAMHLEDSGSPMLLTSDREGWSATIMPMRV